MNRLVAVKEQGKEAQRNWKSVHQKVLAGKVRNKPVILNKLAKILKNDIIVKCMSL